MRTLPFPRRTLAVGIGALLVGAAGIGWMAQARSSAPVGTASTAAAASLSVELISPQRVTINRGIAATGSIAARDELLIGADTSGVRLTEVLVEVGSVVRAGQLLARGDDAQLQAQLEQQEAQIKNARAELAQADANAARAESVADAGVYSAEVVQTRRTAALAAGAKLELAQAQKRELQIRIAHTRIVAPADGVIAKRSATVGAVLQSGTELFRLIRDEQLDWQAELAGHQITQVQAGATVRITLDDGRSLDAKVRLVAPTIDAQSRNGLVHVALPRGAGFKAGSLLRGEIQLAQASVLAVPEGVVLMRDGQAYVYQLGPDSQAKLTRIETGTRQRGLVEVTRGLAESSRVIGTGAGFVKDGERVQVADVPGGSRT